MQKTELEKQIERIVKKTDQTEEKPKWKSAGFATINGKKSILIVKSDKALTDAQLAGIEQVLSEDTNEECKKLEIIISLLFDGKCTCSIRQWANNEKVEVIIVNDALTL